jgi:hypothetical protein
LFLSPNRIDPFPPPPPDRGHRFFLFFFLQVGLPGFRFDEWSQG